jgi:hypothetical protein
MDGYRGYNGLKIKDVFGRGDSKTRPKPDWVIMGLGDGAENCCYTHRRAGEVRTPISIRKKK